MFPRARRDELLVQEIGDELVVYDQKRHQAHRLNRTAALVWNLSDGRRSVADLAGSIGKELNVPANEEFVGVALERLDKAHLLLERSPESTGVNRASRRQALRRLGRVAAVALLVPAVTTIIAPTPAMAQSAAGLQPCDGMRPPCNGTCPPGAPRCVIINPGSANPICGCTFA